MTADRSVDATAEPVVVLDHVTREFRRRGAPWQAGSAVVALDDVSLQIPRGSKFGVVGESGSGKTTLVRLVAALDQPTSGRVVVDGVDISRLQERQLRPLRRRLQLVFQDPMGSLDPRMRIRDVVAEPLRSNFGRKVPDSEPFPTEDWRARVSEVLAAVGLDDSALDRYPHQFSGGQRQRISIARAIAPRPGILLADEAVSALDVSTRGQILDLLAELATTEDFTLLFVSHDLSVIRHVCDRVAVLRRGILVESGLIADVYDRPQHPYTAELLAAVPTLAGGVERARGRAGDPEATI